MLPPTSKDLKIIELFAVRDRDRQAIKDAIGFLDSIPGSNVVGEADLATIKKIKISLSGIVDRVTKKMRRDTQADDACKDAPFEWLEAQ